MIASFKHNFVFIKTQKTAGTSIEMALTAYCGPQDIVAPIWPGDEHARTIDGVLQARNFTADERLAAAHRRALAARDWKAFGGVMAILGRGGKHFYNHMTAKEAEALLPPAFWASALKFTAVRHPYERLVSFAYFSAGTGGARAGEITIEERFDKLIPTIARDVQRYTRDGALVVDEVVRHCHLREDLGRIVGRLGLPALPELPRAKSGYRKDRRPAHEVLSDTQKRRVQESCRLEFELFGYEP